ncbi:MAG: response regulator [Eubacterium sp.]|nr:response regulator [Eubacterium sp.]
MEDLILVVDDARFAREITKKALQNGGYENIVEATTAADALAIFQEKKPCLTLLDITLPDNPDLALLKKLIAIDPQASIVMCSAIGKDKIVLDALKAGAKDFILKPYDEKQFLQVINRVLGDKLEKR